MLRSLPTAHVLVCCGFCVMLSLILSRATEADCSAFEDILAPRRVLLQRLLGVLRSASDTKKRVKDLVDECRQAKDACANYVWTAKGNVTFSSKVTYEGKVSRGWGDANVKMAVSVVEAAEGEYTKLRKVMSHVEDCLLLAENHSDVVELNGRLLGKEGNETVAALLCIMARDDGKSVEEFLRSFKTCESSVARDVTATLLEQAVRNAAETGVGAAVLEGTKRVIRVLVAIEKSEAGARRAAREARSAQQIAAVAEMKIQAHANAAFSAIRATEQYITPERSAAALSGSPTSWSAAKLVLPSVMGILVP